MISLCWKLVSSPPPPPLYPFRLRKNVLRRLRSGICRAEFENDLSIAGAIGTCILSSYVLPPPYSEDEESDSVIDSSDSRLFVMAVISVIPFFNWLSWVFAWLDTRRLRYAVYALVYLAPYIRSNLSLSPEDGLLPIASILLCIFHIQLETSIKERTVQASNKFTGTGKRQSPVDISKEEEEKNDQKKLPSTATTTTTPQSQTSGDSANDQKKLPSTATTTTTPQSQTSGDSPDDQKKLPSTATTTTTPQSQTSGDNPNDQKKFSSAEEKSRDEIRGWKI